MKGPWRPSLTWLCGRLEEGTYFRLNRKTSVKPSRVDMLSVFRDQMV